MRKWWLLLGLVSIGLVAWVSFTSSRIVHSQESCSAVATPESGPLNTVHGIEFFFSGSQTLDISATQEATGQVVYTTTQQTNENGYFYLELRSEPGDYGGYVIRAEGQNGCVASTRIYVDIPPPFPACVEGCQNRTQLDSDGDGLTDDEETDLANQFAPVLIYDEAEQDRYGPGVLFQVTPRRHSYCQRQDLMVGATITYVFLYRQDYGVEFHDLDPEGCPGMATLFNVSDLLVEEAVEDFMRTVFFDEPLAHTGDAERLEVYVDLVPTFRGDGYVSHYSARPWRVDFWSHSMLTSRWWNEIELSSDGHPKVYVSQGKHGLFPSAETCEHFIHAPEFQVRDDGCTIYFEDCDGGEVVSTEGWFSYQNIGEQACQVLDDAAQVRGAFNGGIWGNPSLNGGPVYINPGDNRAWEAAVCSNWRSDELELAGNSRCHDCSSGTHRPAYESDPDYCNYGVPTIGF